MKTLSLVILCVLAAAGFAQTDVPAEPNTSEAPAPTPTPTPSSTPDAGDKTTTSMPGTTTSQAPSTTTAIPAPTAGKWSISGSGSICLMVKLGAKFSFNYTDAAGKDNQTFAVNLPANDTVATGSCGANPDNATAQNIKLTFDDKCSMTLLFKKTKNKFAVNEIDLSFEPSCFPEKMQPKQTVTGKVTGSLFQATVGQSYMCNSDQSMKANSTINSFMVDFVDVQVQAFAKEAKFEFGAAQECPQDAETSNIVPIAVGAALAALVLIVLIAYLISRNRGQRGYESV